MNTRPGAATRRTPARHEDLPARPVHGAGQMPAWRRWLSVLLRAAHLVAVIGFAAKFLSGNPHPPDWVIAVLLTGVVLFAHDISAAPKRLFELAAASVLAKLALIAAMLLFPAWQTPLFWAVVVWSVIFAHAPASFRHARVRWPGGED